MLYGIVAAAKHPDGSYVIGNGATMPWHLPGELKWFRQQTLGKPIIMGRKTFEGLPNGPLKGRENIVLTGQKDWSHPGVEVVHDPDEIVQRYGKSKDPAFITGGAEVYRYFMPHTSGLVFTTIHHPFEGSVKFPLTHNELLSQFDETEKYPDSSDGDISWSRSIFTRKHSKSFFIHRNYQRLLKAIRGRPSNDEGDWGRKPLGIPTESIFPQLRMSANSVRPERMPYSAAFSKDGLIKIKPGFGAVLYRYLRDKGSGFQFTHGRPQWNDYYMQHMGEFINGQVHKDIERIPYLDQLNPGQEISLASGQMSFPKITARGNWFPQPSVIAAGDPWEFVAIGGDEGRPHFGLRLPMQADDRFSLDEAPDWMPGKMPAGEARSRLFKHLRDLLAKSSLFDKKTGIAQLSSQDKEQLANLVEIAAKGNDSRVRPVTPKSGLGTYLSFPSSSSQQGFSYTNDANPRRTHIQLFLGNDGTASLYDVARDPRAFVHKDADGTIGMVGATGGHPGIHVEGLTGNVGTEGQFSTPRGQARPNISIHPEAIPMRNELAKHLFENPDSQHGDFVLSHAGTGQTITPYAPPSVGRSGRATLSTPESEARVQQILARARANIAERNAARGTEPAPQIRSARRTSAPRGNTASLGDIASRLIPRRPSSATE